MNPKAEELKRRTQAFALKVLAALRHPRPEPVSWVVDHEFTRQLFRCSMSVASNYRAECRARSKAEFISKVGTVVEEADETVFSLRSRHATAGARNHASRYSLDGEFVTVWLGDGVAPRTEKRAGLQQFVNS